MACACLVVCYPDADSSIDFCGVGTAFWRHFGEIFEISLSKLLQNAAKKPHRRRKNQLQNRPQHKGFHSKHMASKIPIRWV